jgi:predicted aspartyl protease
MEDGSSVEAQVFSVVLSAEGREDPTLAITFDDAQPVLGAKFLEDLGLRLNAESDELETSRHRGFAFSEES